MGVSVDVAQAVRQAEISSLEELLAATETERVQVANHLSARRALPACRYVAEEMIRASTLMATKRGFPEVKIYAA